MRVKILSGNQTGQVVDVDQTEGEIMVGHQFAELAPPEVDVPLDETPAPATDPAPIPDGGTLVDVEDDDAIAEKPEPEDTVPARVRRRQAKPKATPPASRRKRR